MKRLRKKETLHISNKLAEVDLSIMEAFVTKEMEATEHHVACYPTRKAIRGSTLLALLVVDLLVSFKQALFLPTSVAISIATINYQYRL